MAITTAICQSEEAPATCIDRCEMIDKQLDEACTLLGELIDDAADQTGGIKEPDTKIDNLESQLYNLVAKSGYIISQLRELSRRIG